MNPKMISILVFALIAVTGTEVLAQSTGSQTLTGIYARRALTTPAGSIKILAGPTSDQATGIASPGLNFTRFNSDIEGVDGISSLSLQLGTAYGITDELELGLFLPNLQLFEDFAVTRNMDVFLTYAMRQENMSYGGKLGVGIPLGEGQNVAIKPGVPFLLQLTSARFDTGLFANIVVADDILHSIAVPLRFIFQSSVQFYIGGATGFSLAQLEGDSLTIPLSLQGGYTMVTNAAIVDLVFDFGFPALFTPMIEGNAVNANIIQVLVGMNMNLALM